MVLKINIPELSLLKPKISIFGVGGAGGNALNNMIRANLEGVEFIAANTDAQSLANSLATNHIQLGLNTTKGLGAGSFPDRGKEAAEENIEEIIRFLEGNNMVFITAGMGGGTGTGAAPVIAKLARERNILTVGVVTKPFQFEGKYRMESADLGIEELKKCVDTLIVIPNQNLFRVANEQTTFESAFKMADNVLHAGVRGITDLITMPGLVNLDFADIRTIMTKMGKALMGTGEASGENRAIIACEEAISNPLLDDISIRGAKGVLVNMTGGPDMTLFEADLAVNTIKKEVDDHANIIFGSAFNDDMKGKIRVSIVATGIDSEESCSTEQDKKDLAPKSQMVYEIRDSNKTTKGVETSSIAEKNTFFDPGAIEDPNKDIDKILDKEFSDIDNKSFYQEDVYNNDIEPELETEENLIKDINEENNLNHDYNLDYEKTFEYTMDNIHILEEDEQKAKNLDDKKEKPFIKKKSGFGLFSFMNRNKNENGQKPTKINKKIITEDKEDSSLKNKSENQEVDHKTLDQNYIDEDTDLLNVPAFFRRKK